MGEGNACVGRYTRCSRDAGNDFEGYAGPVQMQGFFAAAAEDKGVAALEADDEPMRPGQREKSDSITQQRRGQKGTWEGRTS